MAESDHTDEKDLDGKTTPTMKNNLRRGVEFFNSKRYEQAILEWSKVLREDPTNRKALDFIQKARTRLSKTATPEENEKLTQNADQCFQTGRQYFEEEEYQMAINQWIRALTYHPDHLDALNYIKKAQAKIEEGAAPTKAKPGAPAPVAAKVLKDSESGAFSREEVKPAPPPPAPAPAKAKVKEEDNKRLAAEAEALYEEILSSPATGATTSTGAKKPGFQQVKTPGGKPSTTVAREPGFIGQLVSFPARHPIWLAGILVVAGAVFATLWYLSRGVDWVVERDKGINLFKQGNCFEASQHFANALTKKDDDAETAAYYGRSFTCQKDWDKAIPALKRALELDGKNATAWYHLALSHFHKNQLDDARNALRKARDNGDSGDDVIELMVKILQTQGKLDELLKEFPNLTPDKMPFEVLVLLGRSELTAQNYEQAKKFGEMAVQKAPTEEDTWLLLVTVLREMGDAQGAMARAKEGIGKLALSPRVHYVLANIQLALGQSEGAIETMKLAEAQGGDFRYHMELGNIWMLLYRKEKRADFKDKAIASFEKASSMATDGLVSLAWGRALMTFGDKPGARAKFQEAADNFNDKQVDDLGYSFKWICYYQLEDWDKALIAVGAALTQNQTPIANSTAKGITLIKKGDAAGAKAAFEAGKKTVAPVEYADITSADIKAMMAGVGL
ncbi:MAG: tetratricopeptide repeat protein [Acidobacteriota bacterium]